MPNSSRRQFLSARLMLPMAGAATGLDLLSSREAGAEPYPQPAASAPKLDYHTRHWAESKCGLQIPLDSLSISVRK
jgi:hypothetical protein